MAKCKYKESCGYEFCLDDCCPEFEAAVETNADRIRAMSDEELAETLIQYDDFCGVYTTDDGIKYYDFEAAKEAELEWLKQPAE